MFRVLTPIIGTSYNCNYSLQKYNKLNKSHLVGQLLNSIHDARTHIYKKYTCAIKKFFRVKFPFTKTLPKFLNSTLIVMATVHIKSAV